MKSFNYSNNWFKLSHLNMSLRTLDKNKREEVKQFLSNMTENEKSKHSNYIVYLVSKGNNVNSLTKIVQEVQELFNLNRINTISANESGITVISGNNITYNSDNFISFQESLHAIESSYKPLVEKGATNLNYALYYASENNHLEIVKYLVEKGATELNEALNNASYRNNIEIVKYLESIINKKQSSYNWFEEQLMKEAFNYIKSTNIALATILLGTMALAPFLGRNKQQVKQQIITSENPIQIYEEMKNEILTTNTELPKEVLKTIEKVDTQIEQEKNIKQENFEQKENMPSPNITVARIIYSEASSIVSDYERELVTSVIINRTNHRGFDKGRLNSMEEVVTQENAFEALNDPKNKNWKATETPETLPSNARHAWEHALELSTGNFKPIPGPSGKALVYYHDKSVSLPESWNNNYWGTNKEIETKHFIFYSIYPK